MLDRWTTADFDSLSWHDCHVHGLRLGEVNEEYGAAELELDIDFIVEWMCREDGSCQFRIAPATLTFHRASELRVLLDYVGPTAGMTPFSLAGIEREVIWQTAEDTSYRWRLPINWPAGEITFTSPGFTQVLRCEPVIQDGQHLPAGERGG